MQQNSSCEANGFNRPTTIAVGAFATAAAFLLAGLPAAAKASVIAPQVVHPQVVRPEPVTPHVVAPSPSPADPASPAGVPASTSPDTASPPAVPEAARVPLSGNAPPTSKPKTPGDKQKELLAELRAALGLVPVPVVPEPTPHWNVFDRVMAVVSEFFCRRGNWQSSETNIEETHEGGSCF
jgi:hypothetical protein